GNIVGPSPPEKSDRPHTGSSPPEKEISTSAPPPGVGQWAACCNGTDKCETGASPRLRSRPTRRPQAGVSRRLKRRTTVARAAEALPISGRSFSGQLDLGASDLPGFLQQRFERLQRSCRHVVLLVLFLLLQMEIQRLLLHLLALCLIALRIHRSFSWVR